MLALIENLANKMHLFDRDIQFLVILATKIL
jgi:hypothetical protein